MADKKQTAKSQPEDNRDIFEKILDGAQLPIIVAGGAAGWRLGTRASKMAAKSGRGTPIAGHDAAGLAGAMLGGQSAMLGIAGAGAYLKHKKRRK